MFQLTQIDIGSILLVIIKNFNTGKNKLIF